MKTRTRLSATLLLAASFLGGASGVLAENPPPPEPQHRFSFVRLAVRDINKSIAFYTQVLGLHEVRRLSPPMVPALEVFLGSDDPSASLIDLEERNSATVLVSAEPNAGLAVFCFQVPDVEAAVKKAVAAGGEVVMPGGRVVWGNSAFTWAVVDDPDGNHIELLNNEKAPAAAEKPSK